MIFVQQFGDFESKPSDNTDLYCKIVKIESRSAKREKIIKFKDFWVREKWKKYNFLNFEEQKKMTTSAAAGSLFRFVTILRPLPTLSAASGNFRIFSINGISTLDQNVRTRFINTSSIKCLPKLIDIGKEQPEKEHYNTG